MLTSDGNFSRILFEQSPFAMQIYSPDGFVIKANKGWKKFWHGSSHAPVDRYNIFKDKQAREIGLTSAFNQALAGISTSLHDVEYDPARICIAGRKKNFHVRMLPLRQGEGQVEGVLCMLEDTTNSRILDMERLNYRKRLEHEVNVRTRQLEALLQFSTELTGLDELQSVYKFVTSWAKSLLGFDHSTLFIFSRDNERLVMEATIGFPESMVGTFFLLEDQGLPTLVARQRRVAVVEDFKTEQRFSIPDTIFEHKLTSSLAVPMMNKDKVIGVLIGHTRAKRVFTDSDISLYQNFANQSAVAIANIMNIESLKRSEKRFRQLFENANDAIYLVDVATRRIVDCNRKALLLDGYSHEEMVGMMMLDLFPREEQDLLQQRRKQLFKDGFCITLSNLHHVKKDGSRLPVEISSSLVKTGGQTLVMNIIRDVSSRKSLEREREVIAAKLRRSRRMEAIGLMAGGIAHDLNNILSGVISYPELLMMRLPEDDPIQDDLQKVMESGKRAADVVADLLTVARGAASVKKNISLNELIKNYLVSPEFCRLISLHPEVTFIPRLAPDVKNIHCSTIHIQKVLLNLATNAAESIGGAGQVVISTSSRVVEKHETDQGIPPGEYIVLSVQDSGSGISGQDLEHIFDPFYTTKVMGRSGTGLGLAVVWNTVQDHNGHISVDSDAGGTTFTLCLPVSSQDISSQASNKVQLVDLRGEGTILVVDDELVQREIAVKILNILGYTVTARPSGEEGLAFLEKNTVDLVLLDMLMAPGINGRQTYERIISIHPGQKAIVVSGFSESEDIQRVMELGACGLLKKPYIMEELGRAVYDAMLTQ